MKKIKRVNVGLVIGIMILSVCSGCSSKKDNKESKSSTIETESTQKETSGNEDINTKASNDKEGKYVEDNKDEYANYLNLKKFFVYGTHFNFEGNISIKKLGGKKVKSVSLCLANIEKNEEDIDIRRGQQRQKCRQACKTAGRCRNPSGLRHARCAD